MSATPLRVDRSEPGIALLTLDVPERRNAMTEELTAAWTDAVGAWATTSRCAAWW